MKTKFHQPKFFLTTILYPMALALLIGCGSEDEPQTMAEAPRKPEPPAVDMHTAVISNDVDAIKQHIAAGSDLNVADPFGGSSPLMSAAVFDKPMIAKLLIEAGADINLTNRDGSTALHSAAFFCRPDIVDMLLAEKADKTVRNNFGSTAYDTVAGPFDEVRPFYDALGQQLAPMGLKLDYEYLQETRPQIAAVLQ